MVGFSIKFCENSCCYFFVFLLQVHFIDYGVCDIINISQMRLLPKQFWTVTKDVVCCALANIQSIGKVFSPQSTDDFWNMVEGESLIATISKLDMKVFFKDSIFLLQF